VAAEARWAVTETHLVRSILRTLQMKGVFCWRVNSGTRPMLQSSGRYVIRGAPAGTPDIIGALSPSGTMFGIEVKTATGQVRASQQRWHDKAARHGVKVAVVRSVGEAVRVVEEWRKG
jgi:hypothetical protein